VRPLFAFSKQRQQIQKHCFFIYFSSGSGAMVPPIAYEGNVTDKNDDYPWFDHQQQQQQAQDAQSFEGRRQVDSMEFAGCCNPTTPTLLCNVDYLSHPWTEMDLKNSWSLITKRKKTYVDGIRLENASWRKWMQQKLNLAKVHPELLRWKKDDDITWLYGPFCPGQELPAPNRQSSRAETDLPNDANDSDGDFESRCSSPDWSSRRSTAARPVGIRDPTPSPAIHSTLRLKSAMKRQRNTLIQDFIKFQQETSRRLAHLPAVAFRAAPSARPLVRRLSHCLSDTELALDINRSLSFLNGQETQLLQYMDDGPIPSPQLDRPSMAGGKNFSPTPTRTNRLRFRAEVEVVEFDRTAAFNLRPIPVSALHRRSRSIVGEGPRTRVPPTTPASTKIDLRSAHVSSPGTTRATSVSSPSTTRATSVSSPSTTRSTSASSPTARHSTRVQPASADVQITNGAPQPATGTQTAHGKSNNNNNNTSATSATLLANQRTPGLNATMDMDQDPVADRDGGGGGGGWFDIMELGSLAASLVRFGAFF
jgi:hypothetical protein